MKMIIDIEARRRVIAKINAAGALCNMAPSTRGRLEFSFGLREMAGIPQVAASLDREGIWRFYDSGLGSGGCLCHEEPATPLLREWASTQTKKFDRR